MVGCSTSIEIETPPERVWAVMSDVERWSEWTESVVRVELHPPGPLTIGQAARVFQPRLPPALWTVTEVVPGQGFTWISRAPGIQVTARHTGSPSSGGSRVDLSIQYGGALGPLLAGLTRSITVRYIQLEAERLKARSEGRR